MGNGNQITPPIPPPPPPVGDKPLPGLGNERRRQDTGGSSPKGEANSPKTPKENAPLLLERRWQNSQADDRRNNLLGQLTRQAGNSRHTSESNDNPQQTGQGRSGDFAPPRNENNYRGNHGNSIHQHSQNINKAVREFSSGLEHSASRLIGNLENSARQASNQAGRGFSEIVHSGAGNGSKDIARQSFDTLFAAARGHKDFREFSHQPKEFWDRVREMSAVRVVESFVKGHFEPRAVSRYGELLDKLNRQGGGLEKFLYTLTPGEREIFSARYQLEKSFGANRLFVGNGVVINERGEFSLRSFLSNRGDNPRLSPHTILSLIDANGGGGARHFSKQAASFDRNSVFFQNPVFFSGAEGLLNSTSAALLSASLAVYQNAGAWLSLENLAAQLLPAQIPTEQISRQSATAQHAFETSPANGATAALQGSEESASAVAALVNGALSSIGKYRKSAHEPVGFWTDGEPDNAIPRFSAGATGAIMSATIGCVAPLAEKTAGEALGFAASIVIGLNDKGLRALGTTAIVSVVAGGVQNLLNASSRNQQSMGEIEPNKFLHEAQAPSFFEDELRQNLFDRRITALIGS